MTWKPDQILDVLDIACTKYSFPMLDNGYFYPAASRLSLFRSEEDWALVIEVFGFSPRSGLPRTKIHTFASRLYNRNQSENYVSHEAYQAYLQNNPYNEFRSVSPLEEGIWMDSEYPEHVALSGEVKLRERMVPLPSTADYAAQGIDLESERPAIFEFCRYLAAIAREEVLASASERRVSILPEMAQILQLEEWYHPDVCDEELPSDVESFRQLADVLSAGDLSLYHPTLPHNTHWSNWPEGGTL